ncbi:MAG: dTDP-4-amino-4,6-dideoxygalactose transaminase [Leptolyngbyaceae cyanobacterium CRU_2_3]|nr:dTDP-4-amino-4,6-dideoxygalactose transaminase [Leptolyngbyaceae cyanobacterium CRU_2_3]
MVYIPSQSPASAYTQPFAFSTDIASQPFPSQEILHIPFNQPLISQREMEYVSEAVSKGNLTGDGAFTQRCQAWLTTKIGCSNALITHSCTAALEMAAILADIQPGDEVIMPSYTFVSTANAFVLRGAVPVFVDIRPDTLNLDETQVEAAITGKTKAIAPIDYAGVSCEMDTLKAIADEHNLMIIEDAAQAIMSRYKGKPVGSLGHMAALSFHQTKNIISGEGGALLINDPVLMERAEIIREKGTNRSKFFRGEVDKYTWVDLGSSYLPSDLISALLLAQLEQAECIQQRRHEIWQYYHEAFADLEAYQQVQRPTIPENCQHNAHIYYLLMQDLETRTDLLAYLKSRGVQSTFHYVPLHSSPAGRKYGRTSGSLKVTDDLSDRLLRLPLGGGMDLREAEYVISGVRTFLA